MNIYEFIKSDEELTKLYYDDSIFRKSIEHGDMEQWSNEQILIFALKNGYKYKNELYKDFTKYIASDCRPIIIDNKKYSIIQDEVIILD